MCGIYGFIGNQPDCPLPPGTRNMREILSHRGPDDHGQIHENGVMIGNVRLSIVDHEHGHQPMESDDARYVLSYNGEIYNHIDIRRELIAKGHDFQGRSDTETVLHAFQEFGPDCVKRFKGMFSFVVFDRRSRKLFFARDRFGVKPLYVVERHDGLAFSSEAKALLPLLEGGAEADWTVLSRFLVLGYCPSADAPYLGMTKVPTGHAGWSEGKTPDWWPFKSMRFGNRPPPSEDEALETIKGLLDQALDRQLTADVPVGLFLSGGLDSALVSLVAARKTKERLKGFTLQFSQASHDESGEAKKLADHLGIDWMPVPMEEKSLPAALESTVDTLDEPFGDSTAVPLGVLSKAARQHVKVALTGWGGDEIFGGYPTLTAHHWAKYYRALPSLIRDKAGPFFASLVPASNAYMSLGFKARKFVDGADLSEEMQHFRWMGYFNPSELDRLLTPDIKRQVTAAPLDPVQGAVDGLSEEALLDRIMHLDARFFLEGNGLFQVDRMSMFASLEARVPLLDDDLADYVTALPASMKVKNRRLKWFIHKLLEGRVPPGFLDKPKKGFGPPTASWLRGPLREILHDTLASSILIKDGIFRKSEVSLLLSEHSSGKSDHGRKLWALLSLALWRRKWIG